MYNFPIGVVIDCYGCDTYEAIKKAADIKAQGVQMYCTNGVNAPENLSSEKRKELLSFVKEHGMVFSAICGDLGRGFGNKDINPEIIEKSKRILDLAKELETDIVTTHIGVVPSDPSHDRYKIMQEACFELAQYADSIGSHFAVETGPEPSAVLKGFLDSLNSKGIAVNLDPANLVMVTGDDPVQAVYNLKDYIIHTHAKDGILLVKGNPEYIYKVVHPVPQEFQGIRYYKELPLGEGNVDFPAYIKALEDIGYKGFLTIECEAGESPTVAITNASEFLRNIIENN